MGNFGLFSGKHYFHNASFRLFQCGQRRGLFGKRRLHSRNETNLPTNRRLGRMLSIVSLIRRYTQTVMLAMNLGTAGRTTLAWFSKESGGTFSNGNKFTVAITVPL